MNRRWSPTAAINDAAQIRFTPGTVINRRISGQASACWAISPTMAPYRIPVMVAFVALSLSFVLWPAQKNLGTLLSCSAVVMLGTQFWHAQGEMYMGWYLPLLLLTIFRPNLEDRIAVTTLGDGWFGKRRLQVRHQAA